MKRVYSVDGKISAPLWFVATVFLVAAPYILCFVFMVELFRGIGRAFRNAWLEVRIEVETALKMLREAR